MSQDRHTWVHSSWCKQTVMARFLQVVWFSVAWRKCGTKPQAYVVAAILVMLSQSKAAHYT